MLRYLTHKLRTQSLNEERNFEGKAQEDHDSGTESDDESGDTNDLPGDQHSKYKTFFAPFYTSHSACTAHTDNMPCKDLQFSGIEIHI